mmetsp:Transcript_42839/g.142591  ORF Transcript_42839/g.142591 Transcript_42839/m.142591 type:complete len:613 (-) Transcript_42839:732-2570(-)
MRIEAEKAPSGGPGHFKRRWRARQALTALKKQYGKYGLFFRALLLVLLIAAAVTFLVLEVTGAFLITTFIASAVDSVSGIIGTAAAAVSALLAAVPAIGLGVQSARESGQSRGDKIFKEAKTVKDELGFLATVKNELNELFDFLTDVFKEETDRELIIVAFVDDLDRCLKGRNVKALEAMQLILSVPGAPMIAFLAIDSRVVVASIEDTFGAVLRDAHISGWEYLDKIVQIPFSLPEPPPEKVDRLVMHTLEGTGASVKAVAARIEAFISVLDPKAAARIGLKAREDQWSNATAAAISAGLADVRNTSAGPAAMDSHNRGWLIRVGEKRIEPKEFMKVWQNESPVVDKLFDVAEVLGGSARSQANLGRAVGGNEGLEITCRAINEALSSARLKAPDAEAESATTHSAEEAQEAQEGAEALFVAMKRGDSDAELLAIIASSPEAAQEKDKGGRLPLHFAIRHGASEAVVRALLQAHPETAKEKTKVGNLPLHLAVEVGASEAVVVALLQANPEAAKEKDGQERLPLHCAVARETYIGKGASEAVVAALLHAYAEAAKEKTNGGNLPLHYAVARGASEGVVAALLHAYPERSRRRTGTGCCRCTAPSRGEGQGR